MKRAGFATGLLIVLLTLTGAGTVWMNLRDMPARMSWDEVLALGVAVGLHLLRVDLFRYWYLKSPERNVVTVGVAGTFLVMGLYSVELAVAAALLQALASAIYNRVAWYRALFNTGLFTTATSLAGWVYVHLNGPVAAWGTWAVISSAAAVGIYFLLQRLCLTGVICLSTERAYRQVWSDNLGWMVLQQAGMGMVGLLLGRFMGMGMTVVGVVLLGSPLFLLHYSYQTFADRTRDYVQEIETANQELASLNNELRTTNDELIQTLSSILDARDRYTFGHSAQVATYSVALGEKLSLPPQEVERLRLAALLHDIGKVGIPESILFKPGPLAPEERRIMQAHAEIGYRITSQIHSLSHVAEIIRQHHEWIGGGGYPRNLKGEQIHLAARIISVADALDTLISDRPYRKGKPVEVAFQEIRRCSGTQFDPPVVQAPEHILRERGGLWFGNSACRGEQSPLAIEVAASMEVPTTHP